MKQAKKRAGPEPQNRGQEEDEENDEETFFEPEEAENSHQEATPAQGGEFQQWQLEEPVAWRRLG